MNAEARSKNAKVITRAGWFTSAFCILHFDFMFQLD